MVGSTGSGGGQVGGYDAFWMVSDKQRRWPMGTVLVMVAVVLVLVAVLCLWRWLVWLVVALVLGVARCEECNRVLHATHHIAQFGGTCRECWSVFSSVVSEVVSGASC